MYGTSILLRANEMDREDVHVEKKVVHRPVGWSGDGGVRESNKVELIKSGGGSRRGRSPLSPS